MRLLPGPRVVSGEKLTKSDFQALAKLLGEEPVHARKIGFVAARQAKKPEHIETLWDGKETENTAQPGEWIVTNLSQMREALRDRNGNLNTYVISAERFPDLYEAEGSTTPFGALYAAKSVVLALRLCGGFDIAAPWGEQQTSADGYLVLNGDEIYGNQAATFEATYEVLPN